MKRSKFLKMIGIGAAAAIVAPKLAIELFEEAKKDTLGFETTKINGYTFHTKKWPLMGDGIFGQIQRDYLRVNDEFKIGDNYRFWVRAASRSNQDNSVIHFTTEYNGHIFKDSYHLKQVFRDINNKKLNHFAEKFYKYVSGTGVSLVHYKRK